MYMKAQVQHQQPAPFHHQPPIPQDSFKNNMQKLQTHPTQVNDRHPNQLNFQQQPPHQVPNAHQWQQNSAT